MVVHPSVSAKDLKSFIELAKANPGMLSYGSAGVGSGPHLAGEQLRQHAAIDIQHIPYRGGGTVITDLLGGQVQFAFATVPTLCEHIKAGRLRAIAVTTSQRVERLPDVPTFAELGLPGVDLTPLFGLVAPAGVPDDIIQTLSTTISTSVRFRRDARKAHEHGLYPGGQHACRVRAPHSRRGPQMDRGYQTRWLRCNSSAGSDAAVSVHGDTGIAHDACTSCRRLRNRRTVRFHPGTGTRCMLAGSILRR